VDLLGISGGMTMDWTPDKYYIMKEWGINPYDPTDTMEGLDKLGRNGKGKELIRLYETLAEATLLPMKVGRRHTVGGRKMRKEIMGVIYFHNNLYFHELADVEVWVEKYNQTSRLLNWSPSNFVELMRKQGFFLAHMKYGVE
tara:strand:+ start:5035 stop:5460 length:426 start_codon:yes stop_codon:yes gene_type:complete